MKQYSTWWQRNLINGRAEVILLWVLTLLVVSVFLFWATAGWAQSPCTYTTVFMPDGRVVTVMTCCSNGNCTVTYY